jgi:hypothetical protein
MPEQELQNCPYHVLKNKEQHIVLSYDFFELHDVWMVHPPQGLIKKSNSRECHITPDKY